MYILTDKLESGTFNRYLVDLFFIEDNQSLTELLKEKKYIKKYRHNGWTKDELKYIIEDLTKE